MIALPSTEEQNFCQVDGDIEGWKYEHDFHARRPYHDSSFSCEVKKASKYTSPVFMK